MINPNHYRFRKPVAFNMYYILLVKSGTIWCIDSATWDEQESRKIIHDAKAEYGQTEAMLVTSPSDDERVVAKIVAACNHKGRIH